MTLPVRDARPKVGRPTPFEGGAARSVREVCLVGCPVVTRGWRPGRRVEWEGRPYRVASLQGPPAPSGDPPRRYAHLVPTAD